MGTTLSSKPTGIALVRPAALSVSTAIYAAGDFIGVHASEYIQFQYASLMPGGGGIIQSLLVTDLDKQNSQMELILLRSPPDVSAIADNGAFDISDTDLPNVVGIINVATADWRSYADNSVAFVQGLSIPFISDTDAVQSLYGLLVSRGTPTYTTAAALDMFLGVLQNG